MPAERIIFSPLAERDLNEIWFEIALDNLPAADRTIDQIRKRVGQLADFPELGPWRPEIADDLRSVVIGNYIVLYRIVDDVVDMVRVVHGARDLTALI